MWSVLRRTGQPSSHTIPALFRTIHEYLTRAPRFPAYPQGSNRRVLRTARQPTNNAVNKPIDIQFGTETEIGITREKPEGLDVVAESIALVRSATAPGVRMRWDYSCEDPHRSEERRVGKECRS